MRDRRHPSTDGPSSHPYTRTVPDPVQVADPDPVADPAPVVVLVPVKAFAAAKTRLASSLDPSQRARLARTMATAVVAAAAPLPVTVVCDDAEVAGWALEQGASVEMTPGVGLNGAVTEAVERLRLRGVARVVVAHGDLPFARDFDLFIDAAPDEVVVAPDRRGRGTNVLSVPTGAGFRFAYGSGSLELHGAEAQRLGLRLRTLGIEELGWDVDEPEDLEVPEHLGRFDRTTLDLHGPETGHGNSPSIPDPLTDDPNDPTRTRPR